MCVCVCVGVGVGVGVCVCVCVSETLLSTVINYNHFTLRSCHRMSFESLTNQTYEGWEGIDSQSARIL